ncbi:MAG: 2-phospho-L-lactate transferase, partial [Acidimicrobiia bacterium]|nr:2-phospho-L-lactate transferase [Acidimicrobiia bacterium]
MALASSTDSPRVGKNSARDSVAPSPRHSASRCQASSDSSGNRPTSTPSGTTLISSPRPSEEVIVRPKACGSLEPNPVGHRRSCPQRAHRPRADRGASFRVVIAALAGGVGAARLLRGLVQVCEPAEITAVVNTGDDVVLHGLHVSPDIDTIVYTLAGAVNPETGWGLTGETWAAMDALERYGGITWFRLGDRDLATHLYRTQRLGEGASLSDVTREVAAAWGLELHVVPMSDDRVETRVDVEGEGEIAFQDYFVRHRHSVPAKAVRYAGAADARPAPGVLETLLSATRVVVCPSNPILSIAPIMNVPGIEDAVAARRDDVVAVSPIVAGAAIKGPADRLMAELGVEPTVVGVARLYAPFAGTLVVDEADAGLASAVEGEGVRCVVAPTVMRGAPEAAALAR